jgi:hypothetical protein
LCGRQRHSEPFGSCTNLVDVAFAAGVHCLAYGALVTQFLDVPQKTLDGLVLRKSNRKVSERNMERERCDLGESNEPSGASSPAAAGSLT